MNSERKVQNEFIRWLSAVHPPVIHTASVPDLILGGRRMNIAKAAGYVNGTPDVAIYEPRGPHHGLFIEFKFGRRQLSATQRVFVNELMKRGYAVLVCNDVVHAIEATSEYLKLPMPTTLPPTPTIPQDEPSHT